MELESSLKLKQVMAHLMPVPREVRLGIRVAQCLRPLDVKAANCDQVVLVCFQVFQCAVMHHVNALVVSHVNLLCSFVDLNEVYSVNQLYGSLVDVPCLPIFKKWLLG